MIKNLFAGVVMFIALAGATFNIIIKFFMAEIKAEKERENNGN